MFVPRIQKFSLGWWRRIYSQQKAVNEVTGEWIDQKERREERR
jgi:hypothetical protein